MTIQNLIEQFKAITEDLTELGDVQTAISAARTQLGDVERQIAAKRDEVNAVSKTLTDLPGASEEG